MEDTGRMFTSWHGSETNRRDDTRGRLARRAGLAALVAIAALLPANATAQPPGPDVAVVCAARPGERITCAADTTRGVTLMKSTGAVACELGKTWGFDEKTIWVRDGCSGEFALGAKDPAPNGFGTYTQGAGFKVADTTHGDLNLRMHSYVRYLNQRQLDPTYTDSFGTTRTVKQRQDIQLNKVNVSFQGWLMSRKFNYVFYVWTQNTAQGQTAQVVLAGNLQYAFNPHVTLGWGINGLPGTRSTEGNFPYWLGVDNRLIADAYFMPSYTTGIFVRGRIAEGLTYQAMLGNNLSQLGVDAGQLGNDMNTLSGAIVWMPTTGEYGPRGGAFGDFEGHEDVATRVGAHYTRSDEDRQSQPDTEAIENAQIRISDGNIVFTPRLFGEGINITDVVYQMASFDAGVKYRGLSLEGEYFWRRIDDFRGTGIDQLSFDALTDTGFQLQASAMVMPKTLQVYVSGSKVFGDYGDPSDMRAGVNFHPWKNRVVRWNNEFLYLRTSPVGALSLPYPVGGRGPVFSSNFEVNF